jgi:hypothetical protein
MLGFAVPTFVAGLFGMNVANFFEESTDLQLSLENHDLISSHIQNRVNGLYCALQVTQ